MKTQPGVEEEQACVTVDSGRKRELNVSFSA